MGRGHRGPAAPGAAAGPNDGVVARHPAETATGLAGAIVVILALVGVDVDESLVVAAVAGVAALPAIITAVIRRVRSL